MTCMLLAMSWCAATSSWQSCRNTSVCWAWTWRSCQSRPGVGEPGCGRGVLQAACAWSGVRGRASGLGPRVSDWSEEEEERSRVGLARGASSSGDRCRGSRRGWCEGPGNSSSSSSWGQKQRRTNGYHREKGAALGVDSPWKPPGTPPGTPQPKHPPTGRACSQAAEPRPGTRAGCHCCP